MMKAMRNSLVIVGILTAGVLSAAAHADIVAGFSDGNSTSLADGYAGTTGNGWVGGWTTVGTPNSGFTNTVINTNPLNGGGNYLSASVSYSGTGASGQGTIARSFDTSVVSNASPLRYTFDIRIDSGFYDSNDIVKIFNSTNSTQISGTGSTVTWGISTQGSGSNVTWLYQNDGNSVSTGVSVVVGTVYHFVVSVDPASNAYSFTLSDGADVNYSSSVASFRNDAGVDGDRLYFGAVVDRDQHPTSPPTMSFSVDNISIAAIPEPAAFGLLGLGYLMLCARRR